MNTREIPDSDPGIPELTPTSSYWFPLGRASPPSPAPQPNHSINQSRPKTSPLAKNAGKPTKTKGIQELGAIVLDSAGSPDVSIDSESVSLPSRRRRRFNFAKWVDEDRRTHEYVYHKRFKNFHGALSDSEDEDYADLQAAANDDYTLGTQEDPAIEEGSGDEEGEEEEEEKGELGVKRDILKEPNGGETKATKRAAAKRTYAARRAQLTSQTESTGPKFVRRRRNPIDSDSSSSPSSSSEESSSEDEDVVPIFQRRLKQPIPAVFRNRSTVEEEIGMQSSLDSSQQFLDDMWGGFQPGNSTPSSSPLSQGAFEAEEDRGGIDFMVHATKGDPSHPGKSRTKPLTVLDLARKSGSTASRALRIAARTAARPKKPTLQRASHLRRNNMLQNQLRATQTQTHGLTGKLFVNQDSGAARTLNGRVWNDTDQQSASYSGITRGMGHRNQSHIQSTSKLPASGPAGVNQPMLESKKRKRKAPRRYTVPFNEELARTSILEKPASHSTYYVNSPSGPHESNKRPQIAHEVTRSTLRSSGIEQPATSDAHLSAEAYIRVRVGHHTPQRRLLLQDFDSSTFVGSKVLDLLEGPALWEPQVTIDPASLFKTKVSQANEASIAGDANIIYDLCESVGVDSVLYDDIYAYFLCGVGYLCDESQIIESAFLNFTCHEWLRLARKLLKLSIRKKWNFQLPTHRSFYSMLTVECVVLSVVLVHKRTSMLRESESFSRKVNLLTGWAMYYHQWAISLQLDSARPRSCRERVGAELVYAATQLGYLQKIPQIFSKNTNAKANWHIMEVLTAATPGWNDWRMARDLLAIDISRQAGVKPAMNTIQKLMAAWEWPGSIEIIGELFTYYAKQQHYADPSGEAIWLPSFLKTSQFNGTYRPDQEFSMFLELLGLTLRKFASSPLNCLRIAGRVTPLSALSFPESQEVSLADLSSASHQYGILIVLLRMLEPKNRPSISQFRDLVVLKNAHWAIKIKAVSAWRIVLHFVDSADYEECMLWMRDDILHGTDLMDNLLIVAMKSSIEVLSFAKDAIPIVELVQFGLASLNEDARRRAWQLVAGAISINESLINDIPIHAHYTLTDLNTLAHILNNTHVELIHHWQVAGKITSATEKKLLAIMLQSNLITLKVNFSTVGSSIFTSLIRHKLTEDDYELIVAAGLTRPQNLLDRRTLLRQVALIQSLPENDWRHIMREAQDTYTGLPIGERVPYGALLGEVRRLATAEYPSLAAAFPLEESSEIKNVETMWQNIQSYVNNRDITTYYYFSYRLRQCCDFGVSFTESVSDADFIAELMNALSINDDQESVRVANIIFNTLFASFFTMAAQVYAKTLKSRVSLVLPTLVKAAIINLGRGTELKYDCTGFLVSVAKYIFGRIYIDPMVMAHPASLSLASLFAVLAQHWLLQSYASQNWNRCIAIMLLKTAKKVQALLDPSSSLEPLNNFSAPNLPGISTANDSRARLPQSMLPVADDVLSSFQTNHFDDHQVSQPRGKDESLEFKQLVYLTQKYLKACRGEEDEKSF